MRFLISALLMTMGLQAMSQTDSLVLLNGKTMVLDINTLSEEGVSFNSYFNSRGKIVSKPGLMEPYRVFSAYQDGKEQILYKQDTLIGNFRTIPQMNAFVLGEKHAFKHHNSKPFFYSGLGLGIAVSVFDTYLSKSNASGDDYGFFRGSPTFLPVLSTLGFTILAGIPRVTIKTSTIKKTYLLQDLDFQDGYERVGRSKQVIGFLKGKVLGVGIGMGTYFLVNALVN